MSRGDDPRKWTITVRELIAAMTGLCASLSLFVASNAIPEEQLYLAIVSNLLIVFAFGGSIGAIGWRLWQGTRARVSDGFLGGGCLLLVFLWLISPFVILLFGGF
jgi:hypothetical protein